MKFSLQFYMDIEKILLAHEFVLGEKNKCDYSFGRGSYGLIYIVDGEAEYRFATGERITVKNGDSLLISADSAYKIITRKDLRHYTINFSIHEDNSLTSILKNSCGFIRIQNSERLDLIFKGLIAAWNAKKMNYEMQGVSILYGLLADFCTEYINQNDQSIGRILISKEYIDQHFDRHITLGELANLSDMSVTNFCREWSKHFECSPLRYRDSIRLHYAKEYLKTRYYSISEVASKCGFEDVNYFSRFFKKHTGISPGKF